MFALARERSEDARIELANMLADLFLSADTVLSLREEELVNELIDQLLLNSTPAVRAKLVEKFANIESMPSRIAVNLARDGIEVAGKVLAVNMHLTDDDLIQVIDLKGGEHALAIAGRASISEAVADALVTTGDVRVMEVVAENLGAHLTSQAIDAIAAAARYTESLRAPILHRPEINADTALKLYWWVEQDLRRYTLKRFGIASGQVDQALATTIAAFLDEHAHEKGNDETMAQVADWMEAHQAITPQVLPQVLRMGHFRLFNMLLARLAHLSLSLVDTIMAETGGRGLAAISRAIGVDKPGFVSLFLLARGGRPGDQVVHPRELSDALATFDRMSATNARDLLHSWSLSPDYFARNSDDVSQQTRATF
ncbi:MAG: DUF2336 domain-containing protein [Alphaproteobacteria bacterium]|nr:DUF2336 domain-containing protein [Alphaproteobacteria bacterium]